MSGANHTHKEAQRAKITRNAFFILCILLCIICIFQQINFSRSVGKNRTVLKSQFISDNCMSWVNDFEASECYLKGIAFGDVVTLMGLHPSNGKLVQERMLARTHASYKNNMARWIYEQVKTIREQQYSFSFYPNDVIADSPSQTVFVKGVLNTKIGLTSLDPEEVTWALQYTVVNGEALISNFYEYKVKGKS